MRLLVTGATGYIGRWCAKLCKPHGHHGGRRSYAALQREQSSRRWAMRRYPATDGSCSSLSSAAAAPMWRHPHRHGQRSRLGAVDRPRPWKRCSMRSPGQASLSSIPAGSGFTATRRAGLRGSLDVAPSRTRQLGVPRWKNWFWSRKVARRGHGCSAPRNGLRPWRPGSWGLMFRQALTEGKVTIPGDGENPLVVDPRGRPRRSLCPRGGRPGRRRALRGLRGTPQPLQKIALAVDQVVRDRWKS